MSKHLLVFLLSAFCAAPAIAQVGVNTITPNASAALDVTASDKGILIPRMDSTSRATIASPATGLLVYQTNGVTPGFFFYNGSTWTELNTVGSAPAGTAGGDLTGSYPNPTLTNIIGAGTFPGLPGFIAGFSVDAKGRITGTSSIKWSAYSHFYRTGALSVLNNGKVSFTTDGEISGIDFFHSVGSGDITVFTSGVFEVGYMVAVSSAANFTLTVNGVAVPASRCGTAAAGTVNGKVIVTINDADVVSLLNTSGATVSIPSLGTGVVNASITIHKVR